MSQTARKERYEDSYNRYINGADYIPGSAAPARVHIPEKDVKLYRTYKEDYADVIDEEPVEVIPEKRVRKRAQKQYYDYDIVKTKRNAFIRFFSYTIIFIGAFLCVASIAYTESRKLTLIAMEQELKQLKIENIILNGEIQDNYNLTEIERYAYDVLGMDKPDETQIVYVDEVKVSYVVHYDVTEVDMSPFEVIKDVVAAVVGLVRTDR